MGNNKAKFKKLCEEIDTSGDKKVSGQELLNFFDSDHNNKAGEVFEEFSKDELMLVLEELTTLVEDDIDVKLRYEQFMDGIKDKEILKNFILKLSTA